MGALPRDPTDRVRTDALPRRLLLATEATPFDVGAHRLALALAGQWGLPLPVVVPLVSNAEFEASAPEQAARADAAAHRRLLPLLADARSAGVSLALEVRRGTALEDEVLAAADEQRCDLLVVRRRGEPGWLAQLRVGARVERVLARARCAVLVCPREAGLPVRGVRLLLEEGRGLTPGSSGPEDALSAPVSARLGAVFAVASSLGVPVTAVVVGPAGRGESTAGAASTDLPALQQVARAARCHLTVQHLAASGAGPQQLLGGGDADLVVVWRAARPGRDEPLHRLLGGARCAAWVEPPAA